MRRHQQSLVCVPHEIVQTHVLASCADLVQICHHIHTHTKTHSGMSAAGRAADAAAAESVTAAGNSNNRHLHPQQLLLPPTAYRHQPLPLLLLLQH